MERFLQTYLLDQGDAGVTNLRFAFGALSLFPSLLLLAAAAFAVGLYAWRRLAGRTRRRDRVVLTLLRAAAVVLVLFLLLDPSLVGSRVRPGEQVVALLFDDSRSMQVSGIGGESRATRLQTAYRETGAGFEEDLLKRFQLIRYGTGLGADRIPSLDALSFQQPASNLVSGIDGALRDLAGAEVAAAVLFSDGVQQPETEEHFDRVAALGIPIYTVGTDTPGPWRDVELESLSVRRSNFDKSPVVVTARVKASSLPGESLVAEILDDGRVVASEAFTAEGPSASHEARLEFVPVRKEWISYEARVRHANSDPKTGLLADKDRIALNNARSFLVDNRDKQYRILYLSGSPTWENKFYRRALDPDEQLRVTSLIRISRAEKTFVFRGARSGMANPLFQGFDDSAKDQPRYDEAVFLRLGPDGSELTTGYPDQPEDLFDFQLLIWGDIEHNFFSPDQLELTRDFVLKRGGTLLLLGGPHSFAEGGFSNTAIDGMLPVVLRAVRPGPNAALDSRIFTVAPTVDGLSSGAWMLDASPDRNRQLWEAFLPLMGLNAFSLTRAGATVMATVKAPGSDNDGQPFFAMQPYGEGRCAALATGGTWPWHMRAPENDTGHERLWRQLTRTLVDGVPEPVALRAKADEYPAAEPADLAFLVRDKRFVPREGLRMALHLTTPTGETRTLDVEESLQEAGVYTSRLVPDAPGQYGLTLSALDETGELVGSLDERLTVVPDLREFQNAQYNPDFLRRLAQATGGRHLDLSELPQLPGWIDVRAADTPGPEPHRWRLWHRPPFLGLLVAMLCTEWYLRRRKGQP